MGRSSWVQGLTGQGQNERKVLMGKVRGARSHGGTAGP